MESRLNETEGRPADNKDTRDIDNEGYDGVCSLEDEDSVPTSSEAALGNEEQLTGATYGTKGYAILLLLLLLLMLLAVHHTAT